jgi:hypothetical protein
MLVVSLHVLLHAESVMISHNPLLRSVRGTLGKTVYFKQLRGETVICNMPKKPDPSKQTDGQRATRLNFRAAAQYAKTVLLNDAALRAYYFRKAKQLGLPNAYTAALTDYMHRGQIEHVSRKTIPASLAAKLRWWRGRRIFPCGR